MTLRTIYDHERGCFILHKDGPKPNAFDWRNFECPVNGKLSFASQNHGTRSSQAMTSYVERKRKTSPTHGTMFGISENAVSAAPLKMMKRVKKGKSNASMD